MVDFVAAQELAVRLINENGRRYRLFSDNSVNPDKPWKQNDDAVITNSFEGIGVFVPPASASAYGLPSLGEGVGRLPDLVCDSKEILIIPYPTNEELSLQKDGFELDDEGNPIFNLKLFSSVTDSKNGKDWGITATQVLQPGEFPILAYIGLKD